MNKVNAVVLAGGKKRISIKEFYNQVIDSFTYGEWYIRRGYKCLKRLKPKRNGYTPENFRQWAAWQAYRLTQYVGYQAKRIMGRIPEETLPRPMVEYSLDSLLSAESIDNIFVVGPRNAIEENILEKYLENPKVHIVQQGNSFGANVKLGQGAAGKGHCLFLTADSPTTTSNDIDECVQKGMSVMENCSPGEYGAVYPVVKKSILEATKRFGARKYFWMIPDTLVCDDYLNSEDFDSSDRVGFRITSMGFADVSTVPEEQISLAYSARKLLTPRALKAISGFFSWDVLSKYRNRQLAMSYIEENLCRKAFGYNVKLIGLSGAGTSFDVDSVQDVKNIEDIV